MTDIVAKLLAYADWQLGRLQSDVESAYAEIERLRRDTHINGEFRLQPQSQSGHKVPGSHVWWQQAGTVEVDGEEWQGLVYFFASPKMESEMDGVISSEDDSHDFTVGEFNCVGGWNNTTIDFSSPLGNLSIDCIGVDCCE